jgi:hypothetical protein
LTAQKRPGPPPSDELDPQAVGLRHLVGMDPDLVAERFGATRVVEEPNVPCSQVRRHGSRMAEIGEGARDYHTLEAGENSANLIGMPIDECVHNADQCNAPSRQPPGIDWELGAGLVPALPG